MPGASSQSRETRATRLASVSPVVAALTSRDGGAGGRRRQGSAPRLRCGASPRGRRRRARGTARPAPSARGSCRARGARPAAPSPPPPTPRVAPEAHAAARRFVPRESSSLSHLSTRRAGLGFSSLLGLAGVDDVPEAREAAGNPARDRAGRELELRADRAVALVAAEEAIEDLVALTPGPVECGMHRQRLV